MIVRIKKNSYHICILTTTKFAVNLNLTSK